MEKIFSILGLGLEDENAKNGHDLTNRLKWFDYHSSTINSILETQGLTSNPFSFNYAILPGPVLLARSGTTWKDVLNNKFTRHDLWDWTHAIYLPIIPKWENNFQFYYTISEALRERKSDEYVFGLDWTRPKDGSETKRYFCCSRTRLSELADFLRKRPKCDRTIYSIMCGGFRVRIIQFDLDAPLVSNMHLTSTQAQEKHIHAFLILLEEFLGKKINYLAGCGSDYKKFSARIYIEHEFNDHVEHDQFIFHFWNWLWEKRNSDERIKSLLIFKKKNDRIIKIFAMDPFATGRNRQMRYIYMNKHGKREFKPILTDREWSVEEVLEFGLPIHVDQKAPPHPIEIDEITIYCELQNKSVEEYTTSLQRPPLESTFLYNFRGFHNGLNEEV